MLSVITFMAVTFLVLSHRERGAVVTTTDQTTARLAADSALERVKLELLARMLANTNDQDFDLTVSTNFINPYGFDPSAGAAPYNVNYNVTAGTPARPLNTFQLQQNIANLLLNPRPPVFVVTNRLFPNNTDIRFYLDLNRNGRFEPNGLAPALSPDASLPYYGTNGTLLAKISPGNTQSNFFVGDPESDRGPGVSRSAALGRQQVRGALRLPGCALGKNAGHQLPSQRGRIGPGHSLCLPAEHGGGHVGNQPGRLPSRPQHQLLAPVRYE